MRVTVVGTSAAGPTKLTKDGVEIGIGHGLQDIPVWLWPAIARDAVTIRKEVEDQSYREPGMPMRRSDYFAVWEKELELTPQGAEILDLWLHTLNEPNYLARRDLWRKLIATGITVDSLVWYGPPEGPIDSRFAADWEVRHSIVLHGRDETFDEDLWHCLRNAMHGVAYDIIRADIDGTYDTSARACGQTERGDAA